MIFQLGSETLWNIIDLVLQLGNETWGIDHSIHALKKDATWLSFVKLQPERDPRMENRMMELRAKNNVDELLRVMARFVTVTDPDVRTSFSRLFLDDSVKS